uniref:Uncharacterized protein n=1 Tax=Anguilla anguilla TaxID=7936 RepID=A0A0E9PT84_ANGAN
MAQRIMEVLCSPLASRFFNLVLSHCHLKLQIKNVLRPQ